MKIIVEGDEYKVTYEVVDTNINDLIYVFRSILALDTYSPQLIEQTLKTFEEE